MKKILYSLILVGSMLVTGCTDPVAAKRVAEDQGFTQVIITGHRFSGCGDNDNVATGFAAVGATGRSVTGVVCGSTSLFGKSNTLRVD